MHLKLVFNHNSDWELSEILYESKLFKPKVSRRGKALVFSDDDGCFQWTRAVKAFSLLVVGTKLLDISTSKAPFFLQGLGGSHAASLDFAISKPTEWISDIFIDADIDQRRRVFKITNSERKLPGPVQVQLTKSLLENGAVEITDENDKTLPDEILEKIYVQLNHQFENVPCNERLISTAPKLAEKNNSKWNNSNNFLDRQAQSAHFAFKEVELLEPLGVKLAQTRLLDFLKSDIIFKNAFENLLDLIPNVTHRYQNSEIVFDAHPKTIRIGAPPMAVAALILIKEVAKQYNLPIEIYSHHNSSSSVVSQLDNGELDLVILSWGAVHKLLNHPLDFAPQALMLLPRTGIDFISGSSVNDQKNISAYFSLEELGYPNQFYKTLEKQNLLPGSNIQVTDSTIVEIVTRLTSEASSYAIVSEPFSIILEQFGDCRILDKYRTSSRISDNVFIDLNLGILDKSFLQLLLKAMRKQWIQFVEDPSTLRSSITELFSDQAYIKSLNQIGGLYKFN